MRIIVKNMNDIFYLASKNQTLIVKKQIHLYHLAGIL